MSLFPRHLVCSEASSEDIKYVTGGSYCNLNTLIVIPTRGMVHYKVIISWKALLMPLSSNISNLFLESMEIGEARNTAIEEFKKMSNIEYIVFLDDDVIVPENALIRLYRSMIVNNYDILAAMYYMKSPIKVPVGFKYNNGVLTNINIDEQLKNEPLDVDVVGMGCTLIRKSAFDKLSFPYFKTVENLEGIKTTNSTEDVYFCNKAKESGLKIGIHPGIRCGHIDVKSGIIY